MIEFDQTELFALFDFAVSEKLNNPPLGMYSHQYTRDDQTTVSLSFAIYEGHVGLSIGKDGVTASALWLNHCRAIRVLDTDKRQFEILFDASLNLRCFVDLKGDIILTISHPDRP